LAVVIAAKHFNARAKPARGAYIADIAPDSDGRRLRRPRVSRFVAGVTTGDAIAQRYLVARPTQ
jgi:hypothetical protein